MASGHKLAVLDRDGRELGMVREELFTFMPQFVISVGEREVGRVRKEFTLFKPSYQLDCLGWRMDGELFGWDYSITDSFGDLIATISKEHFHWMDTYVLDILDPTNALYVLMAALAIDADNCPN